MQVLRAEAMGVCFGVRDALTVLRRFDRPDQVTIHGELVHNPVVLAELERRGFRQIPEDDRPLPSSPQVLVTAHGISDAERARLQSAGKQLIDTTCPLVRRVHEAAQRLAADRRHVVVIGRPGHVEVRGLVEDLDSFDVVADLGDVRRYPGKRLGVVCQSTTPPDLAEAIHTAVVEANPGADIRFIDTICQPTRDRQEAIDRLVPLVEAVVVVGGRNSNNTRQLAQRCRRRGVAAFHVESAEDLQAHWFTGCRTVGLTAGTSTLDRTIDAVHRQLQSLFPEGVSQ